MCPEKINLFKTVSFLAKTVAKRVKDVGNKVNSQLKSRQKTSDFEWFPLTLDGLTNVASCSLEESVPNLK